LKRECGQAALYTSAVQKYKTIPCFANAAHSNINIDFGVKMINHQSQTKKSQLHHKKSSIA
jgi:hypothetical protein